jgi:ribokinase
MKRVERLQEQTGSTRKTDSAAVVVFGSCFLDYVAYVDAIPKPGQTLGSESFAKGFGGKGANQAVMAARLGANVRMVASVGSDGDGSEYIANFKRQGVDTTFVKQLPETATGLAMISVNVNTAENAIVICPNAAAKTALDDFTTCADKILANAKIVVCQNEVPLPATLGALKFAHERNIYTIFNTAPAPSKDQIKLIKPYLPFVSLLCPNEHEATLMTDVKVTDYETAVEAAKKLRELGVKDVVITLGALGACVVTDRGAEHVRGIKVKAVDTTGAGDAFVGSMAYFLAAGNTLAAACAKANICAANSVTKRGTQSSYPQRSDLPAQLFATK